MSIITVGMRPLLIGVTAGGVFGSALALPSLHHDLSNPGSKPEREGQLLRRLSGLAANFLVPAALTVATGGFRNKPSIQSALISGAAAVAGAYWGTRLLGTE